MSNWTDLTILHGNEEGARAAFERACEMVIRAKYPHQTVRGIRVNQGDAGIDVYVGKLGVSPIEVYQCKYSTDGIGDSQKNKSGTHMTLRLTPRTLMKKTGIFACQLTCLFKKPYGFQDGLKNATHRLICCLRQK